MKGWRRWRARAGERGESHRLAVSVPSHCALLAKPAQKLAAAFQSVTLSRPRCAYLSGSTGRVLWQPEKIADDLAMNMARTVRWQEAVISANEREARLAIEMPPGGVLTCLTRQAPGRGVYFTGTQRRGRGGASGGAASALM
jgi:malonate decarboxylase epsilon subunit